MGSRLFYPTSPIQRFGEIVWAPYDFKTFCSRSHKSKRHRTAVFSEMPWVHFLVQKGNGGHPDGHRSKFELRSGHRAVAVRFMLSFQFNVNSSPMAQKSSSHSSIITFSKPQKGTERGLKFELPPFKLSCHRTIAMQSPDDFVKISKKT